MNSAIASHKAGVLNLQYLTPEDPGGADVIVIVIKCTVNVTHQKYPQTIPPPLTLSRRKTVFHEAGPPCGERLGTAALRSIGGRNRGNGVTCGVSAGWEGESPSLLLVSLPLPLVL